MRREHRCVFWVLRHANNSPQEGVADVLPLQVQHYLNELGDANYGLVPADWNDGLALAENQAMKHVAKALRVNANEDGALEREDEDAGVLLW